MQHQRDLKYLNFLTTLAVLKADLLSMVFPSLYSPNLLNRYRELHLINMEHHGNYGMHSMVTLVIYQF